MEARSEKGYSAGFEDGWWAEGGGGGSITSKSQKRQGNRP